MAATRTPGVTRSRDGRFFIDKRYRGIRIGDAIRDERCQRRVVHLVRL